MKLLVFDAGPIISLTTNNLVWLLPHLKAKFKGEFCVTPAVKNEVIDRPLLTKKFKFEAIQVEKLLETGVIKVIDSQDVFVLAAELQGLANSVFEAGEKYISIVQAGEMESLAAVLLFGADALVTDERITRLLVEKPLGLKLLLEKRLHTRIKMDANKLHDFEKRVRQVRILRSVELVTVGFEMGFLDRFLVHIPDAKRELLESVLWGVKLNGCAVSQQEIEEIIKLESR